MKPAARSKRPAARQPAATVLLPVPPRRLWRLIAGGFALLLVAAGALWLYAAGLPRQTAMAAATASARAGFTVRQVDVAGARYQPRLSIYRELLTGGSNSMFLVDLPAARQRLLALPWVEDASIARRWPDRLEVRIIERAPAALWQYQGQMRLIDRHGAVLPVEDLSAWRELPLLVGAEARREAADLIRLIGNHPDIARQLKGAQWLGQGRWDLRMTGGETISLPRGEQAGAALAAFARENSERPLLGRGFVRFDLRIPDKMVVQVSSDGGIPKPRKPKAAPSAVAPPAAIPQSAVAGAAQPQPERVA